MKTISDLEKQLSLDILDDISMNMLYGGDTTKNNCADIKNGCTTKSVLCDITIKWFNCSVVVAKDSTCTPPIPKDSTCGA
ncbi:MAG: hypothetical protein PHD45_04325 [Bacteroidales bacterium]|nr:hypothetical protein [Bacteroidales bacterium]